MVSEHSPRGSLQNTVQFLGLRTDSLNLLVFINISSITKPRKILFPKPVNCRGDLHSHHPRKAPLSGTYDRKGFTIFWFISLVRSDALN
ncbi:hypothetical protein FJQ55_23190 [Rhizobium glycinendophyticum]|uniref:Uncharacterized protein n=1 Tax=Rhizobium glycinendophyticum TaxID=2589807 RepID=A0A504UDR9_9HYPH|nr:hypothetical protein FJQ55_23190 [Rhizobium glycinendophyticum]